MLPKTSVQDLRTAKIIDIAEDEPFAAYARNYKIANKEHAMLYIIHLHQAKKSSKHVTMINRFEFRPKGLKIKGQTLTEVNFTKLFAFLQNSCTDMTGSGDAHFSFPMSSYVPVIDLPYSSSEIVAEKKFQICGLDLARETDGRTFRQTIAAETDSVEQHITTPDLPDHLSDKLIKTLFVKMSDHANELVRSNRGGKSESSK